MSLIEKFHTFCGEVLSVERQISAGSMTALDGRNWLAKCLELQQLTAQREGGQFGLELFGRAKYAMVAFADEYFLRPRRPVSEQWKDALLEPELFQSQCAGEKLFHDIDALRNERRGDVEDLARVYLAILGLGFEGGFHQQEDTFERLEEYRHKLFSIIFVREPLAFGESLPKISPGAYESTADAGDRKELPYLRPWIFALALIVIVWLAAGHLIWSVATDDLHTRVGVEASHNRGVTP